MSRPVALYCRSSRFAWLAVLAGCGALISAFLGQNLVLSVLTCTLFTFPMVVLVFFALQPEVQVYDTHLAVGRHTIPWTEIVKVDHFNWTVPLVVRLTLLQGERRLILYTGDHGDGVALLGHIRRMARNALLDGIPYDEFWTEPKTDAAGLVATGLDQDTRALATATSGVNRPTEKQTSKNEGSETDSPQTASFHLLSPEDEREVELLYQRLKSVGHIDALETESHDPQE